MTDEEILAGARVAMKWRKVVADRDVRIEELEQQLGECRGGFDTSTKMIDSLEAERDRLREALEQASRDYHFVLDGGK